MNDSGVYDHEFADPMAHLRPPTTSVLPPSHRQMTFGEVMAVVGRDRAEAAAEENPDNPKDKFGTAKPCLTFIPPAALAHEAVVMALGARKYGAFNWRSKPVKAKTYVDAAIRHLLQWSDGEELDEQSRASHLAHARACCGILLDALTQGNLIDDRHKTGGFTAILAQLTQEV